MATATHVQLSTHPSPSMLAFGDMGTKSPMLSNHDGINATQVAEVDWDEAIQLATLCKAALTTLEAQLPSFDHSHPYTPDEILSLPLDKLRIHDSLHDLPRRRSARPLLAAAIASLLYPSHDGSLSPLIRYESDRVKLRAWAALQRKYDILAAMVRNRHGQLGVDGTAAPVWSSRITVQGLWDPVTLPVSLDGAKALPMPVAVAAAAELAPFFDHLESGGTHELGDGSAGSELEDGKGEPFYGTKGAEFQKGVVYEDGRMDLCKMVVGPDHIGALMDSLRPNPFVRHFLLGNNIIGPVGAQAIARFIEDLPDRMDTWYLAGNCIDSPGFKTLVDALVKSDAVTNVWLKRNPLGPQAAHDVYRLITGAKHLRTLDLDQTELGDRGVAELFNQLGEYAGSTGSILPLRHIYMNGLGISAGGAKAIASFLESPHCGLTSLYLSCNPLGDEGAKILAAALAKAPQITRLSLQSTGISSDGAIAIFEALKSHPNIRMVDLGQAYATQDLGQAYNYIDDAAVPALRDLLASNKSLEYLNFGHCAITHAALGTLTETVSHSSLLFYAAHSILPDPNRTVRKFVPSQIPATSGAHNGPTKAERQAEKKMQERVEMNVRAKYGSDMTHARFLEDEKRWIVNDRTDVRKIDSVYRNRDVGLARRRMMTLVKDWDAADDTLEKVMNAQGPFCTKRRH